MSALKTWILFFCAAFLLAACSDGAGTSVRAVEVGQSGADSVIGTSVVVDSNGTVFITDSVVVTDAEWSPYYSSGVFCWSDSCEKSSATSSASVKSSASKTSSSSAKPKSSSSAKSSSSSVKSSSSSAKVSSSSVESSSSALPPTVKGKDMTDNRDGKKYKLETVDGVTWMVEGIRYEMASGTYCDATVEVTKEGPGGGTSEVNVCDQFGIYYSYDAAQGACPPGWRLPTQDEVSAALAATEEKPAGELNKWWPMSGRFKLDKSPAEWGNDNGQQGYMWIDDGVLQVQNYGSFQDTVLAINTKRAYNVRCVTTE